GELRCFVSELATAGLAGSTPIKEAAIEFNRTLQEFLKQTTIVPFRFPTMLGDENALLEHLAPHAAQYEEALARLRGMIQIDIRIEVPEAKGRVSPSGTEYLRVREARLQTLHDISMQVRCATEQWIREWRQRNTPRGLRCYVLLPREHLDSFLAK